MAFELRPHTADVAVAATGDTLEDAFAAVANGLAAASCETLPEDERESPADAGDNRIDGENAGGTNDSTERFTLSVAAESREALLFDYLDELIYLRDVRVELPVDNRVERIDRTGGADAEWILEASARGVPLADIDAREVKAVTYSEMRLEESAEGWESYVVFDV